MRSVVTGLVAAILLPAALAAQSSGATRYYPEEIYPGENIVTISNPNGIDRVTIRTSSGVRVTPPRIVGCPTTVDVRIVVENAVEKESAIFTTYDCRGGFGSSTLQSDNWTIFHHNIGPLAIGRDTCTDAQVSLGSSEIERGGPESFKIIDSMVSDHPSISIRMPRKVRDEWTARVGEPLPYQICYRAGAIDTFTTTLRLYVRRRQPHQGLTNYLITKPVSVLSYEPPPPPEPKKPDPNEPPPLPPLVDPTTFRNIIMPTAETLPQGTWFAGNYDIAGWLGGYGITDDLMIMGGGAFIPEFVQKVAVGTVGLKYRALTLGPLEVTAGAQYAYSSAETDIVVFAPYGVLSFGSRASRVTLAGGYSWKTHRTATGSFDENASVVAVGGDVTVKRGWKIAAETYFIEKSGLRPVALTSRWFGERLAFDLGLIVDLEGTTDIEGTGTLSGEIREFRAAPILSLLMIF